MPGNIKITAITGGIYEPSARFRVRQYINHLQNNNIYVKEHIPYISKSGSYWYHSLPIPFQILPQLITTSLRLTTRIPAILSSYKTDITWIQREFITAFRTLENLTHSPRLFDIDDAIWLRLKLTQGFAKKIAQKMDGIICGNSWLANYFSDCKIPIWIIPTAVDTRIWVPRNKNNDIFYIGWIGTSGNYKYLYEKEVALQTFFKTHSNTKLLIVADKRPSFSLIHNDNIEFIKWSQFTEIESVQKMDVGIMPLSNTDWELGKCSYKMLLYMSTGIPVVVTPIGMNKEILNKGNIGFGPRNNMEWVDSLSELQRNKYLRQKMGTNARELVQKYYSIDYVIPKLINVFNKIISG